MLAVLRRELRSQSTGILGLIFLALTLLITGVSVAHYNFNIASNEIHSSLSNLTIFTSLLLPLLTVNSFCPSKKYNGDKLLYFLPIKKSDIVMGKYLSSLILVGITIIPLLFLPPVFRIFGEVNLASSYGAILAYVAFCAAILAFLTFIASVLKNYIAAWIVSYAALVALYFFGLLGSLFQTGSFMRSLFDMISIFTQYNNFVYGLFDASVLLFYLSFAAIFIILSILVIRIRYNHESQGLRRNVCFICILLTVAILLTNVAILFVPTRYKQFDTSPSHSFSLSESTKKYVSSLDESVTIYVINADGGNLQFEHLMSILDEHSNKISVEYRLASQLYDELVALGWNGSAISSYTLLLKSSKRSSILTLDSMYYYSVNGNKMSYSTYMYYYEMHLENAAMDEANKDTLYEFLNNTELYFQAENLICGGIEYVLLDLVPHTYYMSGHGEPEWKNTTFDWGFGSYGIFCETLDLTGADSIPEDANSLLLNAPTSDISTKEAQIIASYLKSGGSLTLMTNEKNLSMPNLMSLVRSYGLDASEGLVTLNGESDNKPTNTFAPAVNADHDSLYYISEYQFSIQNANEIILPKSTEGSVIISKILTTPEDAYIGSNDANKASRAVAVAIEEETDGGTTEIMWFSCADTFDAENMGTDTVLLPVYALLWGGESYVSELPSIPDKLEHSTVLSVSGAASVIISILLIGALPISVATVGIIKRKKRNNL